ncbi:MAG: ATP-binding cassette domain-containing protein [Clostridia bacterium]|nr:ATP-binding cassette domain-containing protein [Clostridia bacterium]
MDIQNKPEEEMRPPRPQIPDYLINALSDHGIKEEEIDFFVQSDLSLSRLRCDVFIVSTVTDICVLSGVIGVRSTKKSIFSGLKNAETFFTETEFNKYAKEDYSKIAYEDQSSSGALVGTDEDGVSKVLAYATNALKDSLINFADYIGGEIGDHDEPHEEFRQDDGHGHHRHGPGMPPPPPPISGDAFCPKCGRKYKDVRRRYCPYCTDRTAVVKRLLQFVFKYRVKVIILILILLSSSALSIVAPYVSSGFYYDQVLDKAGKFYGQLILVLGLIISTRLLTMVTNIISNIVSARIAAHIKFDLKNVIFAAIERLSLRFFSDKQTGALMTQVNRDADSIYWIISDCIPFMIVTGVQVIAIAVIILVMKPILALMYFITLPFLYIAQKKMYQTLHKMHGMRFQSSRKMNAQISDTINGMRVVKSFSQEKDESARFSKVSHSAAVANKNASTYSNTVTPILELLIIAAQLAVTGVGGYFVIKGQLTYGMLLTFMAYMSMIVDPLFRMIGMTSQIADGIAAMSRLCDIMDAESDIVDPDEPVKCEKLSGQIDFDHVDFGYNKARLVLKDVDFHVPSNHILGIVGHTGAGKSTLANLLLRLYDADRGEVKIDGVSVKDLPQQTIKQSISIVSQETYLFIGTILDNIRYANPNATLNEVIRAAKISGAHDFIVKLPDAYQTVIGLGKRELSGGEKQRLSIARAILHDPSILILDEATAAMDTQTERKIQEALEILVEGRTTVMIAHRLSTLRNADSLIVLKDGEICERGTHEELIRAKGEYFKLYSLQLAALKNVGVEG